MKNKPLAIVIGRNYTTRLTLTRAAGLVGCDVVVIQTSKNQKSIERIDASSKYVVETRISNEPNQQELLNILLEYRNQDRKVVLIPADDYAAYTLDQNINVLKKYFSLPHINYVQGEITHLMDKYFQKKLAEESGFKVARGWVCEKNDGVYQIPSDITYPCFTKPQDSCHGPLKDYLLKCTSFVELEQVLVSIAKIYDGSVLIEEYIDIEDEYGVQGISINGKAYIPTVVHKDSSWKGLTATGCIMPISSIPELKDKLCGFIEKTKFTGVFDVDLYVHNGKLYFNELNVRLGANGFALTYGITNLPGLLISHLLGMNIDSKLNELPFSFDMKSFVSEKVMRIMYYDSTITYVQYKDYLRKTDILSLRFPNDNKPHEVFINKTRFLPIRKILSKIRKML